MSLSTTLSSVSRETKYCEAIRQAVRYIGHATNAQALAYLHLKYPLVSATTIHRATQRLANRNQLAAAPPDRQGSMRYETNLEPHDHFMCLRCGRLRDVNIMDEVIPIMKTRIDGCQISGRIVINGLCYFCNK
jgi:Fe2+ or Zn2+ uptake regulation protein